MVELQKEIRDLKRLVICTQKSVLDINDLCEYTSLSKGTIYKLTMNGQIPYYKQAKHLYFDRAEIDSWLKKKRGFNADEFNADISKYISIKGRNN